MARLGLIGLPGAGKTTLAAAVAERWACAGVDTDDLVAGVAGLPAATYLRERGEVAFRELELIALRDALERDAVVSTGAGVVTTVPARDLLVGEFTLWLDADDETLLHRLNDGERPLLGDDHRGALAQLRLQREALYRSCSRARIDASGTIDEVTDLVLQQVEEVQS